MPWDYGELRKYQYEACVRRYVLYRFALTNRLEMCRMGKRPGASCVVVVVVVVVVSFVCAEIGMFLQSKPMRLLPLPHRRGGRLDQKNMEISLVTNEM